MDYSYRNTKRIRKEKGMSLRELAKKSGLSASFLSNYENGKTNITISSLMQIAKALDVSVKALLATEEDSTILVVPKNRRFSVVVSRDGDKSVIQDFLTRGATFDMQVTVMHMPPHSESYKSDHHGGEEFVYIIKGSIVLVFNNQEIVLSPGDMAYYTAAYNHYWKNISDEPAEFLAVASKTGF